jgi:hypothetical protein
VIIPINASSVVGVSADCVKDNILLPLITSNEAVAVEHVERGNNATGCIPRTGTPTAGDRRVAL